MIISVGLLVNELFKYNVIIGVLAISLSNVELPKVIKAATMLTERHDTKTRSTLILISDTQVKLISHG